MKAGQARDTDGAHGRSHHSHNCATLSMYMTPRMKGMNRLMSASFLRTLQVRIAATKNAV